MCVWGGDGGMVGSITVWLLSCIKTIIYHLWVFASVHEVCHQKAFNLKCTIMMIVHHIA